MESNELAEVQKAFTEGEPEPDTKKKRKKKEKDPIKSQKRLRIIALVFLGLGLASLSAGTALLVLKMTAEPKISDAEYIVTKKEWILEDEDTPSVIWNFTDYGKGTLTTNDHKNDYDFIWAIEGDTLKIETNWLYLLEDSFTYELDKEKDELILSGDEETIVFKSQD